MAEYAETLIRDCYTIPEELEPYIDWEGYGDTFALVVVQKQKRGFNRRIK